MKDKQKQSVTIVVPVYADWDSLQECLESLKREVGGHDSVLIVNDCGPEADELEQRIKTLIHGDERFIYERNSKNLGFVGTCNRAVLELDTSGNDILLLNSDAKMFPGSLNELKSVLSLNMKSAVVSPRSNNATICTFPIKTLHVKGLSPEQSYHLFMKYAPLLPRTAEAPTGHGFCMLIRREVIEKQGLFDTVFGKGYGEEVDFCQRARAAGYNCLIANRAFVAHLEARSFSMAAKQKMLEVNNKIIRERYPDFKPQVTSFISQSKALEDGFINPIDTLIIRIVIAYRTVRRKLAQKKA